MSAASVSSAFAMAMAGSTPGGRDPAMLQLRTNNQSQKWVCKPSSVPAEAGGDHLSGPAVASGSAAIGKRPTRWRSPGPSRRAAKRPMPAYLVLQAVGFSLPATSPPPRCALTAPFHPCLIPVAGAIGCVFSVALSLGSPRVAVSHHRALSCSDFPLPLVRRPSPQ